MKVEVFKVRVNENWKLNVNVNFNMKVNVNVKGQCCAVCCLCVVVEEYCSVVNVNSYFESGFGVFASTVPGRDRS